MILCRILVKGPYSDYQGAGTNRKARVCSPEDLVLFPSDYVVRLQAANMVEIVQPVEQDSEIAVIEIDETEKAEAVTTVAVPFASDSAIEFAADHGIDLKMLVDRATGADGRILLTDVRKYVSEQA